MRRVASLTLALVLLLPAAANACADQDLIPRKDNLGRVRAAVLCLHNAERTRRGLPALSGHRALRRAASGHSRDMVRRSYFSHTSPDGRTFADRIVAAGYAEFRRIGENIAWGSGKLGSPRWIVRSWMASPRHRQNILSGGYREIGIGVAVGTPVRVGGATYTADFGRR